MMPKESRIKQLLRDHGLDGAIVSSCENFHYLTGFSGCKQALPRRPGAFVAVIAAREDVPTQLAVMDETGDTWQQNPDQPFRIRRYHTWMGLQTWQALESPQLLAAQPTMQTALDVLKIILRDMDLGNRKLGVEMASLPCLYYQNLIRAFPEVQLEDVSEVFAYARSIKTPEEIRLYRKLSTAADAALLEVSQMVSYGVYEWELEKAFRQSLEARGAFVSCPWSSFSAGQKEKSQHPAGSRMVGRGDVVQCSVGAGMSQALYQTELSRAWLMPEADPVVRRLQQRLREALEKMVAAAQPGLPMKELYRLASSHIKQLYPHYWQGRCGHSISLGPDTAEAPFIDGKTTRPLEPGMVLVMELGCYIPGFQSLTLGDMVLITDTGAQVLTPNTPQDL